MKDFQRRQQIAEGILDYVNWEDDEWGYCQCPGFETHTKKDGMRDCRVMLDGVPTIYCLHQSCAEIVGRMNVKLRAAIADRESGGIERQISLEEMQRRERERQKRCAQTKRDEIVRECLSANREAIVAKYEWSVRDVLMASPLSVSGAGAEQGALFLKSLFQKTDVVWMGGKYDSGLPKMRRHFKTAAMWQEEPELNAPFICPSTFKLGSYSRKNENILTRPYIVLEGDAVDLGCAEKLRRKEPLTDSDKARNRAACLAVINFFRIFSTFELRAIVDSGSKSIHGWFDAPDAEEIGALKVILPALGFDPSVLRPSQPVRFPGVFRRDSNRWQQLLYLAPAAHAQPYGFN